MNQQRQRRFKSARDRTQAIEKMMEESGETVEPPTFDSNCITPGTEFMIELSRYLK